MSDDISDRPSRHAERPDDVTDPLLWQLAIDVLTAHEPGDEGYCHNLQCADQPWPCAARSGAEQSLRLARATNAAPADEDVHTGWPAEVSAPRWGRNAGPVASHRESKAAAPAA
ncbi:hypothetical protein [Micromonospora vulcania]|uniref:Uncharacterized protein n=1 Tax=Micromonospora vulcania TaxID=1441873 RepID=A0ABW1H639_9ACTN